MPGISDLFRFIRPQGPASDSFKDRIPQGDPNVDLGMSDRGGMIVLKQMLAQLGSIPSLAPPGKKPIPAIDAFMFNPDPHGEISPQEAQKRAVLQHYFGTEL